MAPILLMILVLLAHKCSARVDFGFTSRPWWSQYVDAGTAQRIRSGHESVKWQPGEWTDWKYLAPSRPAPSRPSRRPAYTDSSVHHSPEDECINDAWPRPRGFQRIQELALQRSTTSGASEGLAMADFNGDGVLDHFLCNFPFQSPPGVPPGADNSPRLLLGTGNSDFDDASADSGITTFCSAVVAADIDNDGDADLVTTLRSPSDGCYVHLNDGTAKFTLLPMAFDACPAFPGGLAVGDVNNDGCLDVYVAVINDFIGDLANVPSALLLGDGTGRLSQLHNSGAEPALFPCDASFMDLDDDGDADLVVLGCNKYEDRSASGSPLYAIPTPLYFYRNSFAQNGVVHFEDASKAYGIGRRNGLWMSTAFGDFNGDGHLDLYVGQAGCPLVKYDPARANQTCQKFKHALLKNNGDGTYKDVADVAQLAERRWNWGSAFVDVDNSGTHDLVTVGNFIIGAPYELLLQGRDSGSTGTVFLNRNNKPPFELVEEFGIRTGFGLAVGDVDDDGLEDVFIQKSGFSTPDGTVLENGDAVLLLNTNKEANVWLKVRLEGTTSNRDAIGSKVRIWWRSRECTMQRYGQCRCQLKRRVQVRAIVAGSSAWSSHDKVITFGLGRPGALVDKIEVQWPNGVKQEISGRGVKVNTLVDIREARRTFRHSHVLFDSFPSGAPW